MMYALIALLALNLLVFIGLGIGGYVSLKAMLKAQSENHSHSAAQMVFLAREALAMLKADSVEEKVATDVRVKQAELEMDMFREELRNIPPLARQAAQKPVDSKQPEPQFVQVESSDGMRLVDLSDYDIIT